ncbi:formimidoylglutamase [Anoxybacillus ayderensis]|uniref:formimidoylglutamase n=1 Tax=Anoxybacillus sp. ST70 TaxID=2864180 RepID=UPI0002EAE3DC|nr:formimidoylglutamase [Anoxybacillus sp. ST70]AXM87702.1 formimidoylglutamase [Anoxybacillus ayderensis G10]AXM90488.1 formimidoylglutamase [Anoxybacillus ayderensis G10]MBW9218430.1 formimidoylglutamase [Anoxybacillus sp. ST70]THD15735.1 formimidoylglutamase [Anoxybacillus ayderensis]
MFPYLKEAGKANFQDRYVTKANELLISWDGKHCSSIGLIGAPLSKSSISHSGAAFAPQAIRQALSFYSTYSIESGIDLADVTVTDYGDIVMHPTDIAASQRRIAETIEQVVALQPKSMWIVLGGDHSITCPVVSGWQKQKGTIGIIQFDAHHDLRNLEDGGPTNGTPFRRLIEAGIVDGSRLVQIGLRDFANSRAYTEYGKQCGVTMYTIEEVYRLGIQTIIEKSMQMLSGVDAVYVSVDMDVLDQAFAPGCPAIGPGGMDSRTLLHAISLLARYDKVQAMDIVEIDPTIDFRQMTSRIAASVILQFLKGKQERV